MTQHKQFGKRLLGSLDLPLVGLVLTAALLGLAAIFSATYSMGTMKMILVQGAALVIGLVAMFVISQVDYELWGEATKLIYIGNVALLVLVLFIGMGRDSTGTRGWIDLGVVSFQPAEIVKLGFILTFAKHLQNVKNDVNYIPTLLLLTLHMAVLVGLILLQPDAGTAMVFVFIFISMLFVAGFSYKYLAIGAGAFVVAAPVFWYFKEFFLTRQQINRFLVFFDPYMDPTGAGFNVIQSEISIGSGQFAGKGYLQGSQNQLAYLPCEAYGLYLCYDWRGVGLYRRGCRDGASYADYYSLYLCCPESERRLWFVYMYRRCGDVCLSCAREYWHVYPTHACNGDSASVFQLRRVVASDEFDGDWFCQ